MRKIREMIAYVFPVYISDRDGWLVIDDRRPDRGLVLFGSGLILLIAFAIWNVPDMIDAEYYPLVAVTVLAVLVLLFFVLRSSFRELYVFDRSSNSYTFTRQSVLRKDKIEGDMRQFRAAQVEHTVVYDDDGHRSDEYRTVLLLDQALLFGASPSQPLRFKPPIFGSYSAELRIASALAGYLGVRLDSEVDMAAFH